jgi:hypothetical protein
MAADLAGWTSSLNNAQSHDSHLCPSADVVFTHQLGRMIDLSQETNFVLRIYWE